jgi:MscS family membrane protein
LANEAPIQSDTADTAQTAEPPVEVEVEPLADFLPTIADLMPESLIPVWEVVDQIPLVGALVIALSFFLLAVAVRVVIFRSLRRLAGLSSSLIDDRILENLRKPVFTTILFIGLTFATNAAMLPAGTSVIVNLLLSVIVASWMRAILRVSDSLLDTLGNHEHFTLIEARTIPLFDLSTKLLTILIGSYVLLLIWGINPVGWLASAGIVGIAVGFAAKDTLANLFSGFFIVADAPYKIGDYINLDTGERGKVAAIGLRSTRLLTRDDVEITIPNGVIANAKIINESGGPHL